MMSISKILTQKFISDVMKKWFNLPQIAHD